jgi:hypothetical protein
MRKIASGAKTLRLLSRQRATLKAFQPQRTFMRGSLAINMPHSAIIMQHVELNQEDVPVWSAI